MRNKKISNATIDINPGSDSAILGTYTGECADSTITNLNGLDITRDVWETVFASDEYKKGIELGHYIGYLGHPEDPGCQQFKDACIVMTEGHIEPDGRVMGTFNLINTPVGRIVKTMQDAGVTFGISVRGAGDVIGNSVDPETFVFRGFDLVAFPAYPEAIPTFTEIAASSDADKRAKYKKICASIEANVPDITSVEALDVLQAQFAPQSDEYALIDEQRHKLLDDPTESTDVLEEKLSAMIDLYIESKDACQKLQDKLCEVTEQLESTEDEMRRIKRITCSQMQDYDSQMKAYKQSAEDAVFANRQIKDRMYNIRKENKILQQEHTALREEMNELRRKNKILSSRNTTLSNNNLEYIRTAKTHSADLDKRELECSELKSKYDKTFAELESIQNEVSDLETTNQDMSNELKTARKVIAEYQDAYGKLYANAIGAPMSAITVSCYTSVDELQKLLSATSTSNMYANPTYLAVEEPEEVEHEDFNPVDSGLVTI